MKKTSKRIHFVNLFKWRSITALIACIVTIILTIWSVVHDIQTESGESIKTEFEWFTIDANYLTALAAILILPFTIQGILKKRLVYPKWTLLIHYAGAICVTLMFVFVLGFISWFDPELAFAGENIILHLVCPFAVMVSFFMVESNHILTRKDTLLGLIPFVIYSTLYFYNVVVTKDWEDHYMLNTALPFYVSIPSMYVMTYVIAIAIRIVHNKLVVYRDRKLKEVWVEEWDPVSIKIELYSLGVHAGLHQEKEDISIPFDILEEISNEFNVKIEELLNAYTKGVVEGRKEKL